MCAVCTEDAPQKTQRRASEPQLMTATTTKRPRSRQEKKARGEAVRQISSRGSAAAYPQDTKGYAQMRKVREENKEKGDEDQEETTASPRPLSTQPQRTSSETRDHEPAAALIVHHTHTHTQTHTHTHTHTWRWREKRKGATPVVHVLITAIVSLSLPLSSASFLSCSCLVFQKKAFAVRRNAAQAARHTVAPPEAPEPPCLPSRVRASPSFSSVSLSSVSVPSQSLC